MEPIRITRAEYEAKFGSKAPAPVQITRAQYEAKFGGSGAPTPPSQYNPVSFLDKEQAQAATEPFYLRYPHEVAIGASKSLLSTVKGLGSVGQSIGNYIPSKLGLPTQEVPFYTPGYTQSDLANKSLEAKGFLQGVAKGSTDIIGAAIPTTRISELSAGAKALPYISRVGFKPGVARTLAGIGIEGLGQAGLGYVQSGGKADEAIIRGATSGGLNAVTSGLGEVARGINFPQKLYQTIFKDKEIASWANKKGIKGGTEDIVGKLSGDLPNIENKVIDLANKSNIRIKVDEKAIPTLLKQAKLVEKFPGKEDEAKNILILANKIKSGELDMGDAIKVRRILDSATGYTKGSAVPDAGIVASKHADYLRKQINKTDIGPVMSDYSNTIKALKTARDLYRREGNTEAVGAIDKVLIGGGVLTGSPLLGIGLDLSSKLLKKTGVKTGLAQAINKAGGASAVPANIRSAIGAVAGKTFGQ